MQGLVARLERGADIIRVYKDIDPGWVLWVSDGPDHQVVDRLRTDMLALPVTIAKLDGFKLVPICQACQGHGWRWMPSNRGEDAERELCPECSD